MHKPILTTVVLLCMHGVCVAASGTDSKFEFNPTVLDSKDGTGSTLGIEYDIAGSLYSRSFEMEESGDDFNPDATLGSASIGYSAKGTVAVSKERNPKDFLEFQLDAKLRYAAAGTGSIIGRLFTKYESDQGFENEQSVYGLGGTYGKYSLLANNDFIAFDLGYGQVDPKDDTARKQALGGASLEPYYRWDFEFLYMIPISSEKITGLELNYRYFMENDAPAAIKAASLDEFQLATIRLALQHDLYLAYSSGKLPFDRKDDQIFQIGFSYKLQ